MTPIVMRHSFRQRDVGEKRSDWTRFAAQADELGYSIRVTGGVEYTHEINCSPLDFWALVDLSQNAHPDRTADQDCSVEGMVGCCGTCQKWRLRNGGISGWRNQPGNCEHHPKLWTRHDTTCDCGGYVKFDSPNIVLSNASQNLPTQNNPERKPQ